MRRSQWVVVHLVACACALGALAGSAVAGGWAATSLDTLPAEPTAGAPTDVAFTVRQHGVRPVTIDGVSIEIVAQDGTTTPFPGVPQDAVGRYVARVTFPSGGTWHWRAVQGAFGPQDLGTIRVGAAAAAAGGGDGGSSAGGWTALVAAAIVAAMGIVVAGAARGRGARTGDGSVG